MALDNVNLSEGHRTRSTLRSCSLSTLCTHHGRRPKRVGRSRLEKSTGGTGGRPKGLVGYVRLWELGPGKYLYRSCGYAGIFEFLAVKVRYPNKRVISGVANYPHCYKVIAGFFWWKSYKPVSRHCFNHIIDVLKFNISVFLFEFFEALENFRKFHGYIHINECSEGELRLAQALGFPPKPLLLCQSKLSKIYLSRSEFEPQSAIP